MKGAGGGGSANPGAVGQPLDLGALARGSSGPARVPGSDLRVLAVADTTPWPAPGAGGGTWLLLLSGNLIVDLPYGDFRELTPGEALELPAGIDASFEPVAPSVVLLRTVDGGG